MEARLLFVVCFLGLATSLVEGIFVRKISGHGACGVNSAELKHEVEPRRYRVSLDLTNLRADNFPGQTEIQVKVIGNKKDSMHANQIFLNADESMDIEDIWYEKIGLLPEVLNIKGTKVDVLAACMNTDYQVLVVTLGENLPPGSRGKLGFRYKAKFGLVGLSRSSFNRMLTLRFSGNNFARRVFPSFDEPSFLAKFALEIICSKSLKPMSNEVSDVDNDKVTEDGNKVNKFAPSDKIPTKDLVMSLTSH